MIKLGWQLTNFWVAMKMSGDLLQTLWTKNKSEALAFSPEPPADPADAEDDSELDAEDKVIHMLMQA